MECKRTDIRYNGGTSAWIVFIKRQLQRGRKFIRTKKIQGVDGRRQ